VDDVDNIKIKKGTSTKVNIDGGEYLFDGEFYYKDGKTFLRVLDPDGSLSAAKGKMVEVGNLDPSTIRFSQNSVNGFNEVYQSMLKNGWNGDPIDVVRMSDGSLTTIDNTRLLAAKKAKIKAVVRIHEFDDVPPVARFKENPATWGEAVTNRINNQTGGFGKTNPNGSFDEPRN
jgi:filamentous hemagglutinin